MGQELRSIVLEEREFQTAAGLYFDAQDESLVASGNIRAVEMPDGEPPDATVLLRDPLVDGRTEVPVDKQQMVDMVVAFCRDRAIPLPKSGRKAIVRRGERVVLEIELDWF